MSKEPAEMKLAHVPQILTFMNLPRDELAKAIALLDKEPKPGRLAGQIAIDEGIHTRDGGVVTAEIVDQALRKQLAAKAKAATADLKTIARHGQQDHPKWLIANWGNNGVSPVTDRPSINTAAASSVINIAQNIVMLANDHPGLTQDEYVKRAMNAATKLGRFMAGEETLDQVTAGGFRNDLMQGLRRAVYEATKGDAVKDKATLIVPDRNGQGIALNDFIEARGTEVDRGIENRCRDLGQALTAPAAIVATTTPTRAPVTGRSPT